MELTLLTPEFLDSNQPVYRMLYHSETLSINYHEQKFCIKFAGTIEQNYLTKNLKVSVFKVFNKVIIFNTKSANNHSSLHFVLLQMSINIPLKLDISTTIHTIITTPYYFITDVFPCLGPILMTDLKY